MKLTVSISLKEETLAKLQERLRAGNSYRNKSHLVECAIECCVEKVLAISTDKAVHPVNLYGATKMVM